MNTIDWIPSVRASCFHAAAAVLQRRPCADARLAALLAEPAARFAEIGAECRLATDLLLLQMIPLSVQGNDDRRLVESATARSGTELSTAAFDALCDAVAELRSTFDRAIPRLANELQLRGPVLREQWEAYGPGLMRAIVRSYGGRPGPSQATAVLVHPILGGGGQVFRAYGLVTFEAVLANSVPELPEVVRLAWLFAQLEHDGPGEPAALMKAAVTAAEELGLAGSSVATLELASRVWLG